MRVGVEFSAPRSRAGAARFWSAIDALRTIDLAFISIGSGPVAREQSAETVERLASGGLTVVAHLACREAERAAVDARIAAHIAAGVGRFLAVHGTRRAGEADPFGARQGWYDRTADLVSSLRAADASEVYVTAYPEGHRLSPSPAVEMDFLRAKVDAGATGIIFNVCFDPDAIERHAGQIRTAGIDLPIFAGLLIPGDLAGVELIAESGGASVPGWLAERLTPVIGDQAATDRIAIDVTLDLVRDLDRRGFSDLHLFTMERGDLALAIGRELGL